MVRWSKTTTLTSDGTVSHDLRPELRSRADGALDGAMDPTHSTFVYKEIRINKKKHRWSRYPRMMLAVTCSSPCMQGCFRIHSS